MAPPAADIASVTSVNDDIGNDRGKDNVDDDDEIVVLKRTVKIASSSSSSSSSSDRNSLSLLFLGSESQPPYGPYKHTATLFLDLICRSIQQQQQQQQQHHGDSSEDGTQEDEFHVSIRVYRTSEGQFPSEDEIVASDGIILPGSYNSAYDQTTKWIAQLKQFVQNCLVPQKIPTLGVCFGHQIMAQSFEPNGVTTKCPAGSQAGKKTTELTDDGKQFFQQQQQQQQQQQEPSTTTLDLYYSHGDMVAQLPPNAVSLGGNDKVPIQAAVYYDEDIDGDEANQNERKVVAVTFQAHPEYGSSKNLGLEQTVLKIIQLMSDRGDISDDDCQNALKEATQSFEDVERQSIDVMTTSGKLLGWF